jgi:hypothetical protein
MAKEMKKAASVADWLDDDRNEPLLPKEKSEWRDMRDLVDPMQGRFPDAGQLVVLLPEAGAVGHICVWRVSRQFVAGSDGRGGRFEPVGFWSLRNSGGQRIGWDPIGWRPCEEPVYVSKKAS